MNKKVWIYLALGTIVLQLGITGNIVWTEQQVMLRGKEYKFLCTFYDPVQPFAGRYLELNPGSPCVPYDSPVGGKTQYVVLKYDSAGFAQPVLAKSVKPADGTDYLAFPDLNKHFYNACYQVDLPFRRFYVNEEMAPQAEKLINVALRDSASRVWVSVFVYEGKFQVHDVFVNGKPLKAILNND